MCGSIRATDLFQSASNRRARYACAEPTLGEEAMSTRRAPDGRHCPSRADSSPRTGPRARKGVRAAADREWAVQGAGHAVRWAAGDGSDDVASASTADRNRRTVHLATGPTRTCKARRLRGSRDRTELASANGGSRERRAGLSELDYNTLGRTGRDQLRVADIQIQRPSPRDVWRPARSRRIARTCDARKKRGQSNSHEATMTAHHTLSGIWWTAARVVTARRNRLSADCATKCSVGRTCDSRCHRPMPD